MSGKEKIVRIQTPHGTFFIDSKSDKKMAAALESGKYPNESTLAVARDFVNGESTVVDIGAHIGTFAIPIAKVSGKVIAFEPSSNAFPLLSRNANENHVPLTLVNKALGSYEGTGTLIVRNASNAGANTLVSGGDIPIVTLDHEVPHADFIKMDVEGMELDVLRGGTQLIERARPTVLFEVNLSQLRAHGASPRALEKFFTERKYKLYMPFEGEHCTLASVYSATLLTAFIAPRAWLTFAESAPFDLVAIPEERPLPLSHASFMTALVWALGNNFRVKINRMRKMSEIAITLPKKLFPTSWHYTLSNVKRSILGYTKYAQFGEDLVLLELFKDKKDGRYVDVGAHHPYRYSNTYLLYKKGWHGVNIDPNPHTIELFNTARPDDTNICSGVGQAGILTYYRFSDPAVNTFKKEEAEKWKGKSFLKFLGTTEVEVRPLSALVDGPIDLLTVDAEGMDLEVLQSYGWEHYPKAIVVEGGEAEQFLLQRGYTLHAECGASRIYTYGN